MSYFESIEIEMYNKMTYLIKYNDFYAMPKQFKTNALDIDDITKLPKARVEFGRYDLVEDITLLQPVKDIKGTKQFEFGKLTFRFPTCDFNEKIIYIDNMDIYCKSKLNNEEAFLLTTEGIYPQFKRDFIEIEASYRISFHPFKGKYGKV